MKKIILMLFVLLSCSEIFSQTQISLQLVTNTGAFINGLTSDNIKFRRSPYTSGDVIAGLTVTQPVGNLTGNYIVTGFSAFEEVKLFVNDIEQTWFGIKYAGNPNSHFVNETGNETIDGIKTFVGVVIFNYPYISTDSPLYTNYAHSEFFASTIVWKKYLEDLYGRLGATNTWTGGNIFEDNVTVNSQFEAEEPYVNSLSSMYLDYIAASNTLMSRRLTDSFYVKSNYGYYHSGDNKFYFNTPGTLGTYRIAKRGNGQLFDLNPSQFYWDGGTGLNLATGIFNQDSIASKMYSNFKDSTWIVLGEPVSKYRILTLKKRFWANPTDLSKQNAGYYNWKWYFETVSEAGVRTLNDSSIVINHGANSEGYKYPDEYFGVDTWTTIDTVWFPERALYSVTYQAELLFPYVEISGIDARDTAQFRLVYKPGTEDEIINQSSILTVWKDFKSTAGLMTPVEQFYQPESQSVSRTFLLSHPLTMAGDNKWFLQLRGDLNSAFTSIAATKPLITYILIK